MSLQRSDPVRASGSNSWRSETKADTAPEFGTAVVIGGGIAGSLAAWALCGYAARVLVIERDQYPDKPVFRGGVPQARHAHLLLQGGHDALEELMPGIRHDLSNAGAVSVAMSGDLRWLTAVGWMANHPTDLTFLSCTRPVLDHVVRARVYDRHEPRVIDGTEVRFLEGTRVVGLVGSQKAVTGVRIRGRGDTTEFLETAQLIVDASGRSTKLPKWLAEIGCASTPTQTVDAGVTYSTRIFHRPPEPFGFKALYLQATRDQPWTGSLLPVEDDRWIVSLGGMRGNEPTPGTEGFTRLLTQLQLRDPALSAALRNARPASEGRSFAPGPSVRRHYEHRSTPAGLVVLGDAHTTLNPVYGQGVSVAVKDARALREAVRRHRGIGHDAARLARHRITAASRDAWLMSSAEDVRYPATSGGPSGLLIRAQHRILDRVLRRATTDPRVTAAFERIMSLVDRPTALFRPEIVASVLVGAR